VNAILPLRLFLILSGVLGATGPLWAEPGPAPVTASSRAKEDSAAAPATLTVWNLPIVVFRVPVRQQSPAGRAAVAAQRIQALPDDIRTDEIRTEPATLGDFRGLIVWARHHPLFAISSEDPDPTAGESLEDVGRRAVEQLQAVVRARAEQRRPALLLKGLGLSLGAGVLLVLALWLIARWAQRATERLTSMAHQRTVSMLRMDLRPILSAIQRGLVRATAWAAGLVAAYLWLTFAFHQFPYTRPWSERLGGYLVSLLTELGTGVVGAVPGLFAIVVIFLATRLVVRFVDAFFTAVEMGAVTFQGFAPDTARATRRIITVAIWLFALTIAYAYIPGSDSDAFKAVGVFAGLMVSLGSAGLVNQLMSGLVVVYSRALRPGELVRAGETMGLVREVGLLSTKVVQRGEEVTIPNAVLVGSTVTNYSRLTGESGPIITTSVTIGYDQAWRQVHAMLLLAAERTPQIRKQPRPEVFQRSLSDFYVEYELRAHLQEAEQRARALSELHMQIQDAFNEFGVQIMSPHFESQPNQTVVVPKSRWHAAPAAPPKAEPRST
jgi:small-conductance mechanosensitive channel